MGAGHNNKSGEGGGLDQMGRGWRLARQHQRQQDQRRQRKAHDQIDGHEGQKRRHATDATATRGPGKLVSYSPRRAPQRAPPVGEV
jgi:hypothetical protein